MNFTGDFSLSSCIFLRTFSHLLSLAEIDVYIVMIWLRYDYEEINAVKILTGIHEVNGERQNRWESSRKGFKQSHNHDPGASATGRFSQRSGPFSVPVHR